MIAKFLRTFIFITFVITNVSNAKEILGGPAITVQPSNASVCYNGTASFSITSPAATSFQWQESPDGGTTWNNLLYRRYEEAMEWYKQRRTNGTGCLSVDGNLFWLWHI